MGLLEWLAGKVVKKNREKISEEELEEIKPVEVPSSIEEMARRNPGSLILSLANPQGPPTPDNLIYLVVDDDGNIVGQLPYVFDNGLNATLQYLIGGNRVINAIPLAEKGYIAVDAGSPDQSYFKEYLVQKYKEDVHALFRKSGAVKKET